jgi:hypothetical protein
VLSERDTLAAELQEMNRQVPLPHPRKNGERAAPTPAHAHPTPLARRRESGVIPAKALCLRTRAADSHVIARQRCSRRYGMAARPARRLESHRMAWHGSDRRRAICSTVNMFATKRRRRWASCGSAALVAFGLRTAAYAAPPGVRWLAWPCAQRQGGGHGTRAGSLNSPTMPSIAFERVRRRSRIGTRSRRSTGTAAAEAYSSAATLPAVCRVDGTRCTLFTWHSGHCAARYAREARAAVPREYPAPSCAHGTLRVGSIL